MKQSNNQKIEQQLKTAVEALTPNVLDRIDLSTPQDQPTVTYMKNYSHLRRMALVMAACLCVFVGGAGTLRYQYMNMQVDTVIGIDVNPSVELTINRKERILSAVPLNEDAREILQEMDLRNVELNIGVNAIIGSMVTHGYLADLDNAILVTVTNDSVSKAKQLRASVVSDIEKTLEENQVQAVVYDQQVIEDEQIKNLSETYGISYGKAYFLKELIDQNENLSMEDMERLSTMTMEEVATEISDHALALGELAEKTQETQAPTLPETIPAESTTVEETTAQEETQAPETTVSETTMVAETEAATTAPEVVPETNKENKVTIDYVDFEDDIVYVYFLDRVRWKNPTVSVRDEDGNTYAAYVDDTDSDICTIKASGLEGGKEYTFVIGGLGVKGKDTYTTVTGYFETPVFAWEDTETEPEETSSEGTTATTEPEESEPESAAQPPETTAESSEANTPETSSASETDSVKPDAQAEEKPANEPSV